MAFKNLEDTGYAALFISIIWYTQITPEQAISIVEGRSRMLPGNELTPERYAAIKNVMKSPNFVGFDNVEKVYRVNRYDVYEALRKEKRRHRPRK